MAQRDRRDDGRPEQARPRDRTGRPLPYGTTGVPTTEEHAPETVEQALALGIALWSEQRFFEAHECLEAVWHAAPVADRDLWQGVIQLAVAGVHLQRGNRAGAVAILAKAADRLAAYPAEHRGVDVAAALRACEVARASLQTLVDDAAAPTEEEARRLIPAFPQVATGAWFTPDPAALAPPTAPTPVPDAPAWLEAARRRPPRRDGDPA